MKVRLTSLHNQIVDLPGNHFIIRRLEAQALALLQVPRPNIRRHDDDGVLEVDGVAQTVGELAVFEDLQQDVEHIGMRLLDFVEQDYGIRRALHPFGELATFFVAHVSRRRANQLRDRMLLHELGHIEAD